MVTIRQPAVAGQFYPAQAHRLQEQVSGFLKAAARSAGPAPKAIIAPHAGYIYSGPIAGSAYARLTQADGAIRRVILIGPAHYVPVRGLAGSSATAFATPLGDVPLDTAAQESVLSLPQVQLSDSAHRPEHSLEVQLPFLQSIFDDFTLVPLVLGEARPEEVAEVLESLWGGPETVVVISSDLSHYHDYETAVRLDRMTADTIEGLRPLTESQACGRRAINGLLHLAIAHGLQAETVDLRNSGDTAGPRGQVVGYGAFAFCEPAGQAKE